MEFNEIKQKLYKAINKLKELDSYLLEKDSSERSITHKLAMYLQYEFCKHHVDCEYNLNVDEVSKLIEVKWKDLKDYIVKKINYEKILINSNGKDHIVKVFPDIIIHERGTSRRNLVIIELKKNKEKCNKDFIKLKTYTDKKLNSSLKYDYGIYINLNIKNEKVNDTDVTYFKNGKKIGKQKY